ncbi:TonB-dependent receptor [Cupriavidus sp. H18C1]|uniref:TonB-dependent receptor family protein n=1 Tax=Cupriavidus sp. H18C1 TaxID=3241601 RepID=UPI003BB9740D
MRGGGAGWAAAMLLPLSGWAGAQQAPAAPEPDAQPALAPVVVTATRIDASVFDTPASADVVSGSALREGRPQINLSEGLGGVPGLLVKDRHNYAQDLQLSIRGFGARSSFGVRGLRLYVDGIPATMPDGQGQTSNIDIASIDRVEVLRGPASALYGNASGGVVQVWTEPGARPPLLEGSVGAGSYGTWRYGLKASGAPAEGEPGLDYLVSASRFTTDGYRDHSAARKNLGNARLTWRPDADSSWTLVANAVDLSAQDPLGLTRAQFESAPRSAPLAEQFHTRKTVQQTQGGLRHERRIDADNTLMAMVYYGRRETRQFLSIPPAAQRSPLSAGGVIDLARDYGGADLRWTRHARIGHMPLTLIAGLAYDTMEEARRGYENFIGGPEQPVLGEQGRLRRDERNTVWNFDQYLQASLGLTPRWTVEAGLRHSTVRFSSSDRYIVGANGDDSGSVRYDKWLPVGALRYRVGDSLNLYATAGRGFETPTLNEISYRPDGPAGLNFALRPATSTSVEVGAKQKFGGGLLTAALFQTRTDQEIVTATSSGGRASYRNAGRTLRQGVELGWSGVLHRHWQAQLAYSFLDATFRDTVPPGIVAGKRLPGTARHAFYGSLGWAPPRGWRAGIDLRYLSAVPVDDRNSDRAPGYFVTGIHAGYAMPIGRWTLNAFARIDNLFDRRYAGSVIVNDGNGRYFEPAAGRNAFAGISMSYAF